MTSDSDQRTRAAALADRLLALVELDSEMQELILIEEQTDGDFGDAYPGWFWEITFEPTEVEGLGLVRVDVLYQENPEQRDSVEGATLIRRVVLLKAAPGRVDLVEDFGMNAEKIEELELLLPIGDFDPENLDIQALVAFATENPEVMMELLPAIMPLLQQFAGRAGGEAGQGPLGPGGLAAQLREQLGGLSGEFGERGGEEFGGGEEGAEGPVRLGDEPMGGAGSDGDSMGGFVPGGGPRGGGVGPGRRGGGRRGGGASEGDQPRGGGRRGGGRGGSSGSDAGAGGDQPRYTIEDLLRMRDQLNRQGGR